MDQLLVVSQANNQPLSTAICQAVKKYMLELNDEKELLGDKKEWEDFMQFAWDTSSEISQVTQAHQRRWLQLTLKNLNQN